MEVNLHRHLDWNWNYPGETPLGMYKWVFPERFNGGKENPFQMQAVPLRALESWADKKDKT